MRGKKGSEMLLRAYSVSIKITENAPMKLTVIVKCRIKVLLIKCKIKPARSKAIEKLPIDSILLKLENTAVNVINYF